MMPFGMSKKDIGNQDHQVDIAVVVPGEPDVNAATVPEKVVPMPEHYIIHNSYFR
jgi:hypothetical protein